MLTKHIIYAILALGKNNDALIEILVGTKAIEWKSIECYPIVLKLHRSMGDAVTLTNIFLSLFAKNPLAIICASYTHFQSTGKHPSTIPKERRNVSIYRMPLYVPRDVNCLCSALDKGGVERKCFNWKSETIAERSVCIRDVMERFADVGVSDVLFSAVAASFSDYFHQVRRVSVI